MQPLQNRHGNLGKGSGRVDVFKLVAPYSAEGVLGNVSSSNLQIVLKAFDFCFI